MTGKLPDELRDLLERLDRAVPPYTNMLTGGDEDPRVSVAKRLAQGPKVQLGDEAQARIEDRLLDHLQYIEGQPSARSHSGSGSASGGLSGMPGGAVLSTAPVWVSVAVAATVVATVAVAIVIALAGNSEPDDVLYPVKRAVEDGRLALSSDEDQAELHVDYARRRLDEFEGLYYEEGEVRTELLDDARRDLQAAWDHLPADSEYRQFILREIQSTLARAVTLSSEAEATRTADSEWDDLRRLRREFEALHAQVTHRVNSDVDVPGQGPGDTDTTGPGDGRPGDPGEGTTATPPAPTPPTNPDSTPGTSPPGMPTTPGESVTHTPRPTFTPSATASITPTLTLTPTGTASPTPTPSFTPTVTRTPTQTFTPSATPSPATFVVEGRVQAIEGHVVTVSRLQVPLDPDDPILAELKVGYIVRVDGYIDSDGSLIAYTITIVSTNTGTEE
jgi:hypothetical protein